MNNVLETLRTLNADQLDAFLTVVSDMGDNGYDFGCYIEEEIKDGEALVDRLGPASDFVSLYHSVVNDVQPTLQTCPENGLQDWLYSFDSFADVEAAIKAVTPVDHVEDDEDAFGDVETGCPRNAKTGVEYQGGNIAKCLEAGYEDCRFMTFNQAIDIGRVVKKGEKAAARLTKFVEKVNKKTGKKTMVPRSFCVFNWAQTEILTDEAKTEFAAKEEARKAA